MAYVSPTPPPPGEAVVTQTQVTYAQPYPQYAYPPQQVVVQGPPPAQPTQVVVVEQQPRTWTENAATAWLLFGIGFFFPICWCVGAVFIRSSDPAARVPGILNLVFAVFFIIAILCMCLLCGPHVPN